MRRVIATTYQDNLASRRVMEKTGLTLVRTYRPRRRPRRAGHVPEQLRKPGMDQVEYALEKADWERQAGA